MLHFLPLLVNEVPIEFTAAGVDIHVSSPEPALTLPNPTTEPEKDDDRKGEVRLEECFSGTDVRANGRDGGVELQSWLEFWLKKAR